jgi:hypothetical protein
MVYLPCVCCCLHVKTSELSFRAVYKLPYSYLKADLEHLDVCSWVEDRVGIGCINPSSLCYRLFLTVPYYGL